MPMGVDCSNVSSSPEVLAVPHLSLVRKLPRGFACANGAMCDFWGVVWHGSTLPPNGW